MNICYQNIKRMDINFKPNNRRVILRKFNICEKKIIRIGRILTGFPEEQVNSINNNIMDEFKHRHRDFTGFLDSVFDELAHYFPQARKFSEKARRVFCSYFVSEYSIEAAALFNPSIVRFPGGNNSPDTKFVLSLRATGEGHISSVEFIGGAIDRSGNLSLDPISDLAEIPSTINIRPGMTEIEFDPATALSERVIFPVTEEESKGIEDVRLVRFEHDSQITYYGTFTAYDGHQILSKILETSDFIKFKIHRLKGTAIKDKGMALFPRKIEGRYAMISRQDGENQRIMFSDDILNWQESTVIKAPEQSWELIKTGNCGSPMETPDGWLLLTHGVGPLRKYVIGACLLDLHDPSRVIAELPYPLLTPDSNEREGYVPNVLYTCGGVIHNGQLILPYAMSDAVTGFATADVDELIKNMNKVSEN